MKKENICKLVLAGEQETLSVTNFILERKVCQPGEYRTLQENNMYLVAEGEAEFVCGERRWNVRAGCLLFTFAGVPFCLTPQKTFSCYCIRFVGSRADALLRRFAITPDRAVVWDQSSLLPIWQESLLRADEKNIDLLSESMLLYAFSKLKQSSERRYRVAEEIIDYLEEHFADINLKLSDMAEALGYSEKYMSVLFKRHMSVGFSEYLRAMRLRHAVLLLENGVTSVKVVAALSGFDDPLYFSKSFTRAMGVSPRQYLLQTQENKSDS